MPTTISSTFLTWLNDGVFTIVGLA